MPPPPPFHPSTSFWCTVPIAGALTWAIHEFAHYQTGRWLGYDMWLSLNQAGLVHGSYESTQDKILIAMAGPIVTYLQAILALWLIRTRQANLAYPVLFFAFFTRSMAFAMSYLHPNDEARTSLDLGLPMWLLPALVVVILLGMTIAASRTLRVRWPTNAWLYAAASAITTAIVLGDPLVGRILE